MLSFVKEIFQSGSCTYNENIFTDEQKIQVAATTLFIEIAKLIPTIPRMNRIK
jgi:hypothetical protein